MGIFSKRKDITYTLQEAIKMLSTEKYINYRAQEVYAGRYMIVEDECNNKEVSSYESRRNEFIGNIKCNVESNTYISDDVSTKAVLQVGNKNDYSYLGR